MDAAKQRSLSRLATRSTVNHLLPTSSKERLLASFHALRLNEKYSMEKTMRHFLDDED